MRISFQWLKDYLNIGPDFDLARVSESLTLAGLEVEHILQLKDVAEKFCLAKIVEEKKSADEVNFYVAKAGDQNLTLKLSKQKVAVGCMVAYEPNTNKKNDCDGRIIYFDELGLDSSSDPVVFFPSDEIDEGVKKLSDLPQFDDAVFTLGITPNRADALSHLGVSRELSALLELTKKSPMTSLKEMAGPTHEKVAIEIENSEDCPRYAARILENISVEKSPWWLRALLLKCGVRPINNVVDVTNYVMLSRGQPMHAFDFEKLKKSDSRARICVRRAKNKEKFSALDGKEVELSQDDLVVSDGSDAIALAGVIGGSDSAVGEKTQTILLESAYFDPTLVRMTSRRHGISTDSSFRFERGCDPNGVLDALNFAARLLLEISDAKACREAIDAYRKRIDPTEVKLRPEKAQAILGMKEKDFDQDLLRKRFLALGIETAAKRGDAIYFRIPTFRSDITREIDLVEEAARMIGFDKIAESDGSIVSDGDIFCDRGAQKVIEKLRQSLIHRGFFEAINYAFVNKSELKKFLPENLHEKLIEIKNPLSERYEVMRASLLPGLVKCLSHNFRNQMHEISLFELGYTFLKHEGGAKAPKPDGDFSKLDHDSYCLEQEFIAGVMTSPSYEQAFDQPGKKVDYYHLKGVVSDCLRSVGLDDTKIFDSEISYEMGQSKQFFHPGECAKIYAQHEGRKVYVGEMGKIHPQIAEDFEIPKDVFAFELQIAALSSLLSDCRSYKPFSRFPLIERDVALLADEEVCIEQLVNLAARVDGAKETLQRVNVFDIYRGKNIEKGKKSVAISLTLKNQERTLKDEEATKFVNDYLALVQKETKAVVR